MSPNSRPFKNSNLFSNHYLEKLIKDSPEWREAEPEQAFFKIKELYERKARVLENYNESQLEENFIRPVLRLLGRADKMIDAVVYRLYGLTEEEIAIVEGREVAKSHLPAAIKCPLFDERAAIGKARRGNIC